MRIRPESLSGTEQRIDISGASELVGYTSFGNDGGRCELMVGPQHLNRIGLLHGGFVSTLLDNACGIAVRAESGDLEAIVVTASLQVSFIASVDRGRIVATARVRGGGRRQKFVEAELHDEDGRLLATASALFCLHSETPQAVREER